MSVWKKVAIDFDTVKLGNFIEPIKTKYSDLNDKDYSTVYGVTNVEGICITGKEASKDISNYFLLEDNCFAFNPYRVNIGSIGINNKGLKGCVSPAYVVFKTNKELNPEFLFYYLKSDFGNHLINWYGNRGGVRNALRFSDLKQIDIPSIPIEKQLSLLKKIRVFNDSINIFRYELISQSSLIVKLRQSILQEAIEGKLTSDWRIKNPDVEPAKELLKRIAAEKEQLIKEKKIKKQKPLPPISDAEKPFELPEAWEWARLGEIIVYADNLDIQKKLLPNKTIHYVDINSIDNKLHKIREIKEKKVSELSSRARRILKKGYIVYSTVRPYLENIAFVEEDIENCIGSTGFNVFKPIHVNEKYIFNFLLCPYINIQYREMMIGFNSPSITNSQFENTIIPLPPLPEQQAIVNKVETLLSIVDELESQVNNRKEQAKDLMQAVLREAFEGGR